MNQTQTQMQTPVAVEKDDELQQTDAPSSSETQEPKFTFKTICLVATCTLGMVVNNANNAAVSIALPSIQFELHIREIELKWVVVGYPLASACFLLLFGRIADLYGRKKVLCGGLFWLLAFTLGCAFVRDDISLDVLRAIQGIGAAAIIPASLGILADAFPPSKVRSIAFAMFAAGAPLGGAVGMTLGGLLTQLTRQHWRSTFYLNAGLTALCLLGAVWAVNPDRPSTEADPRLDWLGLILVTTSLVLIIFVLGEGETARHQWATPYIIALIIFGVLLFALFIFWQRYLENAHTSDDPKVKGSRLTPPPIMRPSIWTRDKGGVAAIMAISFLNFASFMGLLFWVQLYYQNYAHLSPLQTVVRLVPMTISGLACNFLIALIVGRVPMVYLIASGTAFTACASLLFANIKPSMTYWAFGFPAAVISVIGADFVFAAGTLYIAKVAQPNEQSVMGAVFQTMAQIGTSFGITISTICYNRVGPRMMYPPPPGMPPPPGGPPGHGPGPGPGPGGFGPPPPPQHLVKYTYAFWTTFAMGVFATVLAMIFFRKTGVVGHHPSSKKGKERDIEKEPEVESKNPSSSD